jgi:putative ABC transport system permease protein
MRRAVPLARLQLLREKPRLFVALAGVAFAVVLVSMQLGFRAAMYDSAVRYHRTLRFDLAMLNPKTPFIGFPKPFSRRRLYQALGEPSVAGVTPLYIQQGYWKNPWDRSARNILVVGVDPSRDVIGLPAVSARRDLLTQPDVALFDARSRPEYGPVPAALAREGALPVELNDRRIEIRGLFALGTSFGIDGSLITSDLNFRRLFPQRAAGLVDLGLIHLKSGADAERTRRALAGRLERDVVLLTRHEYVRREVAYWAGTTPIGFVFAFGAIMGLAVGGVIVYQILFADVSEHRVEYATLKALGYTNRRLSGLVLWQAALLAGLGFAPGVAISLALYAVTERATSLPLDMTAGRALAVFALTLAMCGLAAMMALRRVRDADPAEVFR